MSLEDWPYRRPFKIARATLTHATNLQISVSDGFHVGAGECEPHETDRSFAETVNNSAEAFLHSQGNDLERNALQNALPASPIRNAIDCALWDLEAKRLKTPVSSLIAPGGSSRLPITGTVSLDKPSVMAEEAASVAPDASVLKVKLGGAPAEDIARLKHVRAACPDQEIIVDANGGWDVRGLETTGIALHHLGVRLIEQPLPPGEDQHLSTVNCPVPLCADESVTDAASLDALPCGYAAINIKLDKCGGLTEALELADAAKERGLRFMVGSNGGTSLAAAPAYWLAARGAIYADIDSPKMLARDRPEAMVFEDGFVHAPSTDLWG
ncbi:MAG: dipeptide epimerase [Pseudomonadota bacterium]